MSNYDDIDRNEVKHMSKESKKDLNADIITGEPGSHPVGTGVGGVGGAQRAQPLVPWQGHWVL